MPFDPSNNPGNQNFEKIKKKPGHIIILHLSTTNDDHMMYSSWDIEQNTEFFVISGYFLLFYPTNNKENRNFEKVKKTPGGIIILNMSNINENHIMYDSWDMEQGRIFSHFGPFFHFLPFHTSPPNNPENPNFEKMKQKPGDIIILHKCTINDNHMIHGSWDMKWTRQLFFVILGHFFALLPP